MSPFGRGVGVGVGVPSSPFSQPLAASSGGFVSPFSISQQPGPSGISGIPGITSPSGLFRGSTLGVGDAVNRPPSGITGPFGGSAGGLTAGGGLFSSQAPGGLFSGTQTPPRPVSGFSSVSGIGTGVGTGTGSYFGSNASTHTGTSHTLTLKLAPTLTLTPKLTLTLIFEKVTILCNIRKTC